MSKADTLLKKATFFERLAIYGDRKSYLKALAQDRLPYPGTTTPNVYQYPEFQETDEFKQSLPRTIPAPVPLTPEEIQKQKQQEEDAGGGEHVTFKDDHIKGLPPINPNDQQAVINFAIQEGYLLPNPKQQMPDGRLGSETRKALEGVKNYFAKLFPQNPRMTDQQAITAAKTPRR